MFIFNNKILELSFSCVNFVIDKNIISNSSNRIVNIKDFVQNFIP